MTFWRDGNMFLMFHDPLIRIITLCSRLRAKCLKHGLTGPVYLMAQILLSWAQHCRTMAIQRWWRERQLSGAKAECCLWVVFSWRKPEIQTLFRSR